MALEAYRQKRDFRQTSEPRGIVARGEGQRFVVQEHHARRLHYDFRLEMGGVLKSWAVPKGPSLNPADRRLAVMTEDHPVKYIDFQGHIPEGNYGAGDMAIWDSGSYEVVDGDGERGVRRGKLVVRLHGRKLHGEFHLVRMRDEENQWLMMKGRDEYADPSWQLEPALLDGSESPPKMTKRTSKITTSKKETVAAKASPEPRRARMPAKVSPMMATLIDAQPPGDDYLYEMKWDGFRAICFLRNGKARLVSRNHNDLSAMFPEIVEAVEKLKVREAVFDGEIVALDAEGKPSFQLLQNRTGIKTRERKKEPPAPVVFYLFDLLYLDGLDYTPCYLEERRAILRKLLPKTKKSGKLRFSEAVRGAAEGAKLLEKARASGLEGVIAKAINTPYVQRRSEKWMKLKIELRQEVVIGGYTAPRRSRKRFGAVVVGLYKGDELRYVGHTGGGFNTRSLELVYQKMKPLGTDRCPFVVKPHTNEAVQWIEPQMVCEVKFTEWTSDERMRHPIFLGLREDKNPRECVREKPVHMVAGAARKSRTAKPKPLLESVPDIADIMQGELRGDVKARVGDQVLSLTNLHKKYWPTEGYTKGDLLRYYYTVAEYILPHLRGRPLILQRYPNGIKQKPFFQHNMQHPPEFMRTWEVVEPAGPVRYALCEDLASLLYLVNLGTIAQHHWLSRIGNLERPDWIVFDLDPENIDWSVACEVAVGLNKVLGKLGLNSYAKTSGSAGMHVYVPLEAKYSFGQSRGFAELVAGVVRAQYPDVVTTERLRAKREHRHLYLDFMQNEGGKSVASAYSVRAVPGATVSAPLTWAEVKRTAGIGEFTMQTMPARLKQRGDLFSDVLEKPQRLEEAVSRLEKLLQSVPAAAVAPNKSRKSRR